MLLRSSSTPLMNSMLQYCKDQYSSSASSSPELESIHFQQPKTSRSSSLLDVSMKKMLRAFSESDLKDLRNSPTTINSPSKSKCMASAPMQMHGLLSPIAVNEEEDDGDEEVGPTDVLLTLSTYTKGLELVQEGCEAQEEAADQGSLPEVLVVGGGNGIGGGGRICHGGGGGGGSGGGGDDGNDDSDHWDSYHDDSTDVYYQKMIEANPTNSLLLSNYARYLKEVRADYDKAEEYCGRAILADPGEANVLSLYADLIWLTYKDASRAQNYFDRALRAAPKDCYVMASYARFLWDADDS